MIKKLSIILFLSSFQQIFAGTSYTISRFDYSWCTNSYPTPYVSGNFSIIETSTANSGQDGFSKNQNNKTIIIDLPAGFQFNTAAASTVTSTGGTDLSSISFVFTSTTRITVTLSSDNPNDELNTLDFNNFEIRANSSGSSGNIVRNGGTFDIESATTNPTAAEPLGTLTAATPFVYTSSAITQLNTSNVTQFSINQEIIRIKITGTGSCNGTVTQFDFNTDGGNGTGTDLPTTNISTAKIYYTGTSTTFATTAYFGATASPNGAFSITGSQGLLNGDNYFWLTYDVPGDANTAALSNRLDAQLVSFVLEGVTKTDMATPTPAGSRPIIAATFYYSRFTGNWNTADIWSATDNGPTCSCSPNGSGVVVIDTNHTITANLTRTVDVITIQQGATLTGGSPLTINSSLTTAGTGKFTLTAKLTVLGNVTLSGSGASTCSKIIDIDGDLTVNVGASLSGTGGVSAGTDQNIFIGGNLTVDGSLTQSGGKDIQLDVGAAFVLAGTGTITTSRLLIMNSGNKTVPAGSDLTIASNFSILGAYVLTNNGTINLTGNLDASSGSAKWVNAAGSVLNYGGGTNIFTTAGVLEAVAISNTVNYNGAAQSIKFPNNSGQYNNITLSGSSTKTLTAGILVSGNWVNNATLTHNSQEVTFNGSTDQTISGTSVPVFYDLTANKSAGKLIFSTNATVANLLTLTNGAVDLNSTTLTMSNSATTAITRASGYIISEQTDNSSKLKWNIAGTTGAHVFPFGTIAGTYIPLTLNLTAGTIGNVTTSTYPTAPDNTPYPVTPTTVTQVNDNLGNDNSANTVDRFWQIDKDGASGTATITFVATAAEVGAIANLKAQNWVGSNWANTLGGQSNTATSATVPSVTVFGPWALRDGDGLPLPIELLLFDAKLNGNNVDVKWITASEINNDFFTVEKSADAINFETVGTVDGAGNSTYELNYSLVDDNPYKGVSYYRLKQTDLDGKYTYSNIVAVEFGNTDVFNFNVFPNPCTAGSSINVSISSNKDEEVLVVVYGASGKENYSKIFILQTDSDNVYAIDESGKLAAGVYLITATSNQTIYSKKLIVK